MPGFNILPRSKETCHCLTGIGFGAISQVGRARKDILRMLPVKLVRVFTERRLPLLLLRNAAHQSRMLKR